MWGSPTPPDDALLDLLEEQLALISAHFGYLPLVEGVSSDAVGDAPLPTHSIWAHLDDASDPGMALWFGTLPFALGVRFSRKGTCGSRTCQELLRNGSQMSTSCRSMPRLSRCVRCRSRRSAPENRGIAEALAWSKALMNRTPGTLTASVLAA